MRDWEKEDYRNLYRFLMKDEKETLEIQESVWRTNDNYDKYYKKYIEGEKDAQTINGTEVSTS